MNRVILIGWLAAGAAMAAEDMSQYAFRMIGHAHIDLAYRWRWNEVVHRVGPDTFRGVLRMMEQEPGLTFAQSQMALYEAMQKEYPELFQAIRKRIAEGRWVVVGGMWSEPDMMIPSGESFVRQFLIGKQYARRELGVDVKIGWTPDAFTGQVNTLPQILAGCGIDYYVFGRGQPPDKKIFWWEGPDGGRVLSFGIFLAYSVPPLQTRMFGPMKDWSSKAMGVKDVLVLYGRGDHGGGPREDDIKAIHAMRQLAGAPKVVYDTPQRYLETFAGPLRNDLPVYRESLGGMERISYTSQARTKQSNREAENLLLTAEKFNTIGTFYQRKPNYPRVDFNAVWKPVLRNQFHDVLPGTSNGRVYDDAEADYRGVMEEGRALLLQGLEHIGARIDTTGEGIPLVVYNPLSWARSDAVEAKLRFVQPTPDFVIREAAGKEVVYQKLGEDRVLLLARDVPSIGYKTLRALPGRPSFRSGLAVSADSVENEFIKVTFTREGTLAGVFDKAAGRETLASPGNVFELFEEDPLHSSSWTSVLTGRQSPVARSGAPEWIEKGPLRAVMRVKYRTGDSAFRVDTIVQAGVPRIEFEVDADWHDKDRLLSVKFPTAVQDGMAAFEKPYGFEETRPDGTRQCVQQWADLSGAGFGVSLMSAAKYEYYAGKNLLRLGLLRGSRDMDPRMDEGRHVFRYALYPHAGGWREANTVRQAYAVNHPLLALQESRHTGVLAPWGNRKGDFSLPAEKSFVEVTAPNVVISVVKMQQEEWTQGAMIVRIHETAGRPARGELLAPFEIVKAERTNHIEETIASAESAGNRVKFELRPRELRTYKLTFRNTGYE